MSKQNSRQSTHPNQTPTQKNASAIGDLNFPSNPFPSNTECKYPHDGQQRAPLRKKIYEWSLSIATTGLLVVNIFLWRTTNKAADAARDGVDLARKNAHADQRAWLGISYGKWNYQVGKEFALPVEVTDTGRTPARRVNGEAVTLFLKDSDKLVFDYNRGELVELGTLLPNAQREMPIYLVKIHVLPGEKITPLFITKDIANELRAGTGNFFVYGHLSYSSVSGVEHWIKFCGMAGATNFDRQECVEYNDVDNNEEK